MRTCFSLVGRARGFWRNEEGFVMFADDRSKQTELLPLQVYVLRRQPL